MNVEIIRSKEMVFVGRVWGYLGGGGGLGIWMFGFKIVVGYLKFLVLRGELGIRVFWRRVGFFGFEWELEVWMMFGFRREVEGSDWSLEFGFRDFM